MSELSNWLDDTTEKPQCHFCKATDGLTIAFGIPESDCLHSAKLCEECWLRHRAAERQAEIKKNIEEFRRLFP